MRRSFGMAIAASVLVVGTAEVGAQGAPGAATPPLLRPYARLFGPPVAPLDMRRLLNSVPARRMQELPSGTKCHIIVIPVDPTIDPHFSTAPESKTRFLLREIPTDRVCR